MPLMSLADASFSTSILTLAAMGGKAISLAWFIVLFCLILGLLISLTPSRRTFDFKKPKED
jgi:hypothetical protein